MKRKLLEIHIDLLLSRWLRGEATEEERTAIQSWAAESEENTRVLESFRALMSAEVQEPRLMFADSSFSRLQRRLRNDAALSGQRAKADLRFNILRVAAAALFLVVGIWAVSTFLYTPIEEPQNHAEYVVKSNPSGQRALIYLPDGSTLWLNAESTIRYEKNFHDSVRLLQLTGEAYFMVKEDALKPFMVQAGNVLVAALGTAFNVDAYEESEAVQVALQSGKVKVQKNTRSNDRSNNRGVMLHPGEMASVPLSDNIIRVNDFDAGHTLAWKDGIIHFKAAAFEEVIKTLERWYGVQFDYQKRPGKAWRYTGTHRNEYLENILQSLSFGEFREKLQYEFHGDTVMLNFEQ